MAFNPPLQDGIPLSVPGELFLLHRKDIGCEIDFGYPRKKVTVDTGHLYMTTLRMTYVARSGGKDLKNGEKFLSFDVPFSNLFEEKFKQPIFGANYFTGTVTPLEAGNLMGEAKFKFFFKSGGYAKLLPMMFDVMFRTREEALRNDFFATVQTGAFIQQANQAYVDPSDPTTFYVSQPTFASPVPAGQVIPIAAVAQQWNIQPSAPEYPATATSYDSSSCGPSCTGTQVAMPVAVAAPTTMASTMPSAPVMMSQPLQAMPATGYGQPQAVQPVMMGTPVSAAPTTTTTQYSEPRYGQPNAQPGYYCD